MDHLVDWSFRITSGDGFPGEAIQAMEYLNERFGVSHFAVMPEYDARRGSVPLFLLGLEQYEDRLREKLPTHLKIKLVPRVYLSQGLSETEHLNRLSFGKDRYLALQLPWGDYNGWMDRELHRLLYDHRFRLLLTSCELYSTFYPKEIVEKLFRIPHAVYQFHFRALDDAALCRQISSILAQNKTVLLGTSSNSLGKLLQHDLSDYQKAATDHLSVADCQRLLHQSRAFWNLPQR